ncbi:MAG TPA: hypothetical protein VHJ77_07450 [Vicinamibacterales bacterium]|jgi:hypothetical protein|nr:hypothetical protein [Vicinamibacterales bacterium]
MRRPLSVLAALGIAALPAFARQHQHHEPPTPPPAKTPAASPSLASQIEEVRLATARYRDHGVARDDGYRLFGSEGPLMGEHWYRSDLVRKPLALDHPSTLQYATIANERRLVGVAYTTYRRPTDPMPEGFAGSDDHWHVHDVVKLARAISEGRPLLRFLTENKITRGKLGGGDGRTHLTMVHAWIWLENPDGMFANDHPVLPYLRAGLPESWVGKGRLEAARGLALAAKNGCASEIKRIDALAQLERAQRRAMEERCDAAASEVRAALARPGRTAAAVNQASERAWRGFVEAKDGLLTPDQKRRLASIVEHDPSHSDH